MKLWFKVWVICSVNFGRYSSVELDKSGQIHKHISLYTYNEGTIVSLGIV